MALSFPLLGWEAWQALRDTDNSVRQWLPHGNTETAVFDWFTERFGGEEVVVVSWEGCTITDPRLQQLAAVLERENTGDGTAPFSSIQTSQRMLHQLTDNGFGLSHEEAVARLRSSFVGPDGQTGCAVLALSAAGKADRHAALDKLRATAEYECGIPSAALRMAGPVVDNVALDVESQQTIRKYLPICILLVVVAGIGALRCVALTGYVFLIALYNALFSLALLRWCGGQMNLVLIMLPTLVYVLSISSAVHLVNYFREARQHCLGTSAVCQAVKDGWKPCLFAALTTACGMASLGLSQIAPVRDFGIFCALSMLASFATTFLFLPAMLACSTRRDADPRRKTRVRGSSGVKSHPLAELLSGTIGKYSRSISIGGFAVMALFGIGLLNTDSTVRILGNFSDEHRILQDYAWLEDNIGPMIPVEVVIVFEDSVPLDNLQRIQYVQRACGELNSFDEVAGTISPATFLPAVPQGYTQQEILIRNAIFTRLDQGLGQFVDAGLLSQQPNVQAWRISARIKALENIDYGQFIGQLREQIEPVLVDSRGQRMEGVHVAITGVIPLVYRAQRQLLNDLATSFITAFAIISVVTALVVRSLAGGCVAMLPNLFPVVIVFGAMGLLGIPIRISAVLTASAALGIAVDDTLHFFTWVQRAVDAGANRRQAVHEAYARCAPAMFQTTLINGIGMVVYMTSIFLPTKLFATLMFSLLAAALVGDLVFLPALLIGPLGAFLRRRATRDAVSLERDDETQTANGLFPALAAVEFEQPGGDSGFTRIDPPTRDEPPLIVPRRRRTRRESRVPW